MNFQIPKLLEHIPLVVHTEWPMRVTHETKHQVLAGMLALDVILDMRLVTRSRAEMTVEQGIRHAQLQMLRQRNEWAITEKVSPLPPEPYEHE